MGVADEPNFVVMYSSASNQKSLILKGDTYSLFSKYLIEFLHPEAFGKPRISVYELFERIEKKVREDSLGTKYLQQPAISPRQRENNDFLVVDTPSNSPTLSARSPSAADDEARDSSSSDSSCEEDGSWPFKYKQRIEVKIKKKWLSARYLAPPDGKNEHRVHLEKKCKQKYVLLENIRPYSLNDLDAEAAKEASIRITLKKRSELTEKYNDLAHQLQFISGRAGRNDENVRNNFDETMQAHGNLSLQDVRQGSIVFYVLFKDPEFPHMQHSPIVLLESL